MFFSKVIYKYFFKIDNITLDLDPNLIYLDHK